MTFNPYHQWLGLDPRLKNPHYFQLLGVASTVSDPKLFQAQVAAAAKAKLEVLKQVDAGSHASTLEQLRKRIVRAQQVLSDDKLRATYVAKLKSDLAANKKTPQKKSKKNIAAVPLPATLSPSSVPPSTTSRPLAIPTQTPVVAPHAVIPPTAVPELPVPFVPSAMAAAQNAPAAIPMAVPIPQQGAVPIAMAAPVAGTATTFPATDSEVGIDLPIKLRPIRKKKKSRIGQLFFAVMTLLIVGITAGGFYFIVDRLMPAKNSANGDVATDRDEGKAKPDKEGPSSGNLQPLIDKINENGLLPEEFDEGGDAHEAGSDRAKPPAENILMPANPPEDSKSNDVKTGRIESNEKLNSMLPTAFDANEPSNVISLSDSELNRASGKLQRIRRSLFRRDRKSATRQIAELDNRFDTLLKGDRKSLDASQQRLLTHLEANKHAVDLLDGFWAQVINSSVGISGGQEIEVGNQIVGFVEGADDYVVLRVAGANIHYDYEYLAPGLAVALAKHGSIADIPTWRMQQAAFYFLYADSNNQYYDRADELIVQSVADGHDDSLLREFGSSDFSELNAVEKVDVPDQDSIEELLGKFRSEHGYKDPRRVKTDEAFELANSLLDSVADSQEQLVANLEEARLLAISAKDAYLAEDAILELVQVSNRGAAEVYLDSLLAMTRQRLAGAECRKLMETAIPVLQSTQFKPSDAVELARLKKGLFEMAGKNQMVDAQRRLSQLE